MFLRLNYKFTNRCFHRCMCGHMINHLAMSDSFWSYGLQHAKLLCPWDFPGKNTGVGCQALLQGMFLTQGSKPRSPVSRTAGRLYTHWATWEASTPVMSIWGFRGESSISTQKGSEWAPTADSVNSDQYQTWTQPYFSHISALGREVRFHGHSWKSKSFNLF